MCVIIDLYRYLNILKSVVVWEIEIRYLTLPYPSSLSPYLMDHFQDPYFVLSYYFVVLHVLLPYTILSVLLRSGFCLPRIYLTRLASTLLYSTLLNSLNNIYYHDARKHHIVRSSHSAVVSHYSLSQCNIYPAMSMSISDGR